MTQEEKELIWSNEMKKYKGTSWEVELDHHKVTFLTGIEAAVEYLAEKETMNEKKVILDWMEWYLGFKPSYEMIQSVNTYMTDKGCPKEPQEKPNRFKQRMKDVQDRQDELKEKEAEWFLHTHWTENRA